MDTQKLQHKSADGQGMAVDFGSTVQVIEAKLAADIELLKATLARSSPAVRDFSQQNQLLSEVQAGIRAVDVLTGRTNLTGHPNPTKSGFTAVEHALLQGTGHNM
jgi:hypothetical protein